MKKKSGIYQIKNLVNGKVYIGSSVNLNKREKDHIYNFNNNKDQPNIILQRSWNKHGPNNFVFEMLEEVEDLEDLVKREQFYLDLKKSYLRENGYNIRTKAENNMGVKHSEEAIRKMSGENNHISKLNWDLVKKIRNEYSSGNFTVPKLAKKYNVHNGCIQQVIENRSWFDKSYFYQKRKNFKGENNPAAMLNKEKIREIREKYSKGGETYSSLSKEYKVSIGAIQGVLNNTRWKDPNYIPHKINNKFYKKLSYEIAEEIRNKRFSEGLSVRELMKLYNTGKKAILDIINYKTYKKRRKK